MSGSDRGIIRVHNLQEEEQEFLHDFEEPSVFCKLGVGVSVMETSGSPADAFFAVGTVNG